ncbi:MAG TPA: hypothetical protein VF086_06405 [Propionibacteriaceae bacterium]
MTDSHGASATDSVTISVGNTAPATIIETPANGTTWSVGDVINFSGRATDVQDGTLPSSALSWDLILQHCPSNCHSHTVQTFVGVASGSFVAPDHEYPSHLELRLTATDSGGLTDTTSVQLDPRTVTLTLQTDPKGLKLAINGAESRAPFSRTVIIGSTNTISAVSPQTKGNRTYTFSSWTDGALTQTRSIVARDTATTYTAEFIQGNRN